MDTFGRLAAQWEVTAAALCDTAQQLPGCIPAGHVLAVAAPGGPGDIGRALHSRLAAALDARAREATAAAARCSDAAQAVRTAAARYADTDDAVHQRHRREL